MNMDHGRPENVTDTTTNYGKTRQTLFYRDSSNNFTQSQARDALQFCFKITAHLWRIYSFVYICIYFQCIQSIVYICITVPTAYMHSLYGVYILSESASQTQRIDPLWGLSLAQRRRECSQNSIMMGAWGLSSCSCQEKMTTDIYYKYTYICSILYTLYGTLDFVNYFYRAYVPCGIWRNFFLACLAALSQL